MDKGKDIKLLLRQLKDIQHQAGKILNGNNSAETIEDFSRYSKELKNFIILKVDNDEIKHYTNELKDIKYSKVQFQLWQFLLLPSWFIIVYKNHIKKKEIINEINTLRGKYANIEILIKQNLL